MRRLARKSKILPRNCHLRYLIVGHGYDITRFSKFLEAHNHLNQNLYHNPRLDMYDCIK